MFLEQILVAMQKKNKNNILWAIILSNFLQLLLIGNVTFSGLNGLTISGNGDLQ